MKREPFFRTRSFSSLSRTSDSIPFLSFLGNGKTTTTTKTHQVGTWSTSYSFPFSSIITFTPSFPFQITCLRCRGAGRRESWKKLPKWCSWLSHTTATTTFWMHDEGCSRFQIREIFEAWSGEKKCKRREWKRKYITRKGGERSSIVDCESKSLIK